MVKKDANAVEKAIPQDKLNKSICVYSKFNSFNL